MVSVQKREALRVKLGFVVEKSLSFCEISIFLCGKTRYGLKMSRFLRLSEALAILKMRIDDTDR